MGALLFPTLLLVGVMFGAALALSLCKRLLA